MASEDHPDIDALRWEVTDCPLCGAFDDEELLLTTSPCGRAAYRLVACRRCGLGYLNPRPDQRSIGLFYPADYLCYQSPTPSDSLRAQLQRRLKRLVMARHFGTLPPLRRWHEKALAWLASWWLYPRPHSMTSLPYQGQGRLLDYGCGAGWFAWQMRELGWDVTGMDFSEHATAHARRFGIPTLTGTLPHRDVAPSSYDVITMGAVLEHIHHPHRLIAAAAEALRPGGYLVVSVPNLDSWGFRHFGEDWWGLQLPHHLLHFTPATLRRLLTAHGLEVRRLRLVPRPGWMRRSLSAARKHHGGLLSRLGSLRLAASLLTRWTGWIGQPDCIEALASRPGARAAMRPAA